MLAILKADFVHEVDERTQADGLGLFPPPISIRKWVWPSPPSPDFGRARPVGGAKSTLNFKQ
jgi:hypothetical protein